MIIKSKLKTRDLPSTTFNNLYKSGAGFTLVELLASVIVLVAIGSVVAGIITSSLRGANKTNTIENIRQNGNYVLNQMSKDIQYAQAFDGKNTGLRNSDEADTPYETSCLAPVKTSYKYITVKSTNSVMTNYNCESTILSANGNSLIDASIFLQDCSITCTQTKITDVPIIEISFTLAPNTSSSLVEKTATPIKFETSVTMKNYKK